MKLANLFLLLPLAFVAAESQTLSKVVCAKKNDILKVLKGRDGPLGTPGVKGDRGLKGDYGLPGRAGDKGGRGLTGLPGRKGEKGWPGTVGETGVVGESGLAGKKGDKGEPGRIQGESGIYGELGDTGDDGQKGGPGEPGLPGVQIKEDTMLSLLNDYYVLESGYYNPLYYVTSPALTDGRTDTGGWGSKTAKNGSYIQTTYVRPVFVTSVTVAGGFIPSWGSETKQGHGFMDLEYSVDESDKKTWRKVAKIQNPVGEDMVTHNLTVPVTAQYWRLISTEDNWVGTTEFALKPLVKSG